MVKINEISDKQAGEEEKKRGRQLAAANDTKSNNSGMQLYFTSTFRFIPCHVYRECICIWTRVYVCAGRNRIRNRIRIPTPKLESPDTVFVVLGRSFSLTLQCSAPSAHIAARRAARRAASFPFPFPIPPLRALVRHIGKSFWQNCGTKGARYCIADSVCGCMCLCMCVRLCVRVFACCHCCT